MTHSDQARPREQNHGVSLRTGTVEDAKPIAEMGRQTFTASFGHSVSNQDLQTYLDESYTIENITKDIMDADKDFVVATTTTTNETEIDSEDINIEGDGEVNDKTRRRSKSDEILGFVQLTRNTTEPCLSHIPNTIELQRIYVRISLHGHGIGKILIEKVEDMARNQGFEHIWLGVWEENYKAQKFYRDAGYEVVGEHDFYLGEVRQVDLIMVKKLV